MTQATLSGFGGFGICHLAACIAILMVICSCFGFAGVGGGCLCKMGGPCTCGQNCSC